MLLLRRSCGALAQCQARCVGHKSGNSSGHPNSKGHPSISKHGPPEPGSPAAIVEGLEGRETQFSASKERALLGQVHDYETEHGGLNDRSVNARMDRHDQVGYVNGEDTHQYDAGDSGVSLYSVMQSQVPDPFNPHGRNPTHLNMPGGGKSQQDKYLASNLKKSHPSRHYSTSSRAFSIQAAVEEAGGSPQGIQGDNCIRYKLWLENCQRFNFSCEDQLQGIQGGRKTLSEVFAEQEMLIRKIAEDFKNAKKNAESGQYGIQDESSSYSSMQGLQDTDWLAGHSVESLSQLSNPCPQGIQGEDCERFKLWLDNCSKYHFINCEAQLQDVQAGRKTLAQIFEEQERLIEEIAHYYLAKKDDSSGRN